MSGRFVRTVASLVLLFASLSAALGQSSAPSKKKTDGELKPGAKENRDSGSPKGGTTGPMPQVDRPLPSSTKPASPANQLTGPLVVSPDDVKDLGGALKGMVLLTQEAYKRLQEKVQSLEKQNRGDRKPVHVFKIHAKSEGDVLSLRIDVAFQTDRSNSAVFLGLKGAVLTNEVEIDQKPAFVDQSDEGYLVWVEREGRYQTTIHARVPILRKKSAASERTADFGLPGAAVTTLSLELPGGVKELRWNKNVEKKKKGPAWQAALGRETNLSLVWKEPTVVAGQGSLLSVEGQITVTAEESFVRTKAELTVEDLRGQAKEWQVVGPPGANYEIVPPAGLTYEWTQTDSAGAVFALKPSEPSLEKWLIKAYTSDRRPAAGQRLRVGPFLVASAFRQQGGISVQTSSGVSRESRIVFHPGADVFQRDILRGASGAESEAKFQYWSPPGVKTASALLELEWRRYRNLFDTSTEHTVQLRAGGNQVNIEWLSKLTVRSASKGASTVELWLPPTRPSFDSPAPILIAGAGAAWAPLISQVVQRHVDSGSTGTDWQVRDESGSAIDLHQGASPGLYRATLNFPSSNKQTLTLQARSSTPLDVLGLRQRLPYVPQALDRGIKVDVQGDDGLSVAQVTGDGVTRQRIVGDSMDAPPSIDIAWRWSDAHFPYEIEADGKLTSDAVLIRQKIRFPSPAAKRQRPVALRLAIPREAKNLQVLEGGRLEGVSKGATANVVMDPVPVQELTLEFEVPTVSEGDGLNAADVGLAWPMNAEMKSARLRFWADPAVSTDLSDATTWRRLPPEIVPGKAALPHLVASAIVERAPCRIRWRGRGSLEPDFAVIQRSLIQVRLEANGVRKVRARYALINAGSGMLDVELPIAVAQASPVVRIDGLRVPSPPSERGERSLQIDLRDIPLSAPTILDIAYDVPLSTGESLRLGRLTLSAPVLAKCRNIGVTRWQYLGAANDVVIPLASGVHSEYRWVRDRMLLTPQPWSTSDAEQWFTRKDSAEAGSPTSLTFTDQSQTNRSVFRAPRWLWWAFVSGVWIAGFGWFFHFPYSRSMFWLLMGLVGVGLSAGAAWLPALAPAVLFGLQPGLAVTFFWIVADWAFSERERRRVRRLPSFSSTLGPAVRQKAVAEKPSTRQQERSPVDSASNGSVSLPPVAPQRPSSASQART